jgi:uncharacterized membrane protein
MDREFQIRFVVFVAVTAASLVAQVAVWIAPYYVVRRLLAKVQKAGSALQQYGATARGLLDSLKRSLDNVAEASERVKSVAREIGETSQKHLRRIDQLLDDVVAPTRMQGARVDMDVPKPLGEIQGLAAGLRWALALGISLDQPAVTGRGQHAGAPATAQARRGGS